MYSPRIDSKQIKKLYHLRQAFKALGVSMPMTRIVKEALDEYIPKAILEIQEMDGSIKLPDELTLK